ncbi:hypothetical protein K9M47_04180 [Candidatus Gracilibacteria bacterium]|nr:hypothetical protein [Candidatus Gracilibacteria bacterium]MCF7898552.1 hypothetical protein [Candidatus Paceibacterota bacterium]
MNIVIKSKFSPFQEALRDAVTQGFISEKDVEQIKKDGAKLVSSIVFKFFPLVKEGGYSLAVKMADVIISLGLISIGVDNQAAKVLSKGIQELAVAGFSRLKQIGELPEFCNFGTLSNSNELDNLFKTVFKKDFETREQIKKILDREILGRENLLKIRFARKVVEFTKGKSGELEYHYETLSALSESSVTVINSYFFSLIFNLDGGYDLSSTSLRKVNRRKRPTVKQARNILRKFQDTSRGRELVVLGYESLVSEFFEDSKIASFFSDKEVTVDIFISTREKMDGGEFFPLYINDDDISSINMDDL